MLVLGIDIGTQGARVVTCDSQGIIWGQAEAPFPTSVSDTLPRDQAEQDPETWWIALQACLGRIVATLGDKGIVPEAIEAISVTSTSGTIVPVSADGQPLRPALMYNDNRARTEAETIQIAGQAQAAALGYRFNSSFAISKILWLCYHEPRLFETAHHFIHATDFIIGRLTGEYGVTDFSNALKTGYDLLNENWPPFIEAKLGIPLEKLPHVVRPGAPIAETSAACAEATGLPAGIPVLAGMTDGCASQISTGAVAPGDWNSTLGTTLVIKGVTQDLIADAQGRIYSHRHPAGYWLPGGASNTGGEAISHHFAQDRWDDLNAQALELAPTNVIRYPLVRQGERFPFARPKAEGFVLNPAGDEATDYVAHLEGVGYIECLAYDVLMSLGAQIGDTIYSAGGATRSRAWSQLRADILGRTLVRPEVTGGAMGAAIIAATGCWYESLISATRAMVSIVERVEPRPALTIAYQERYRRFCQACVERGYIDN